jgi:hypothetical protein
MAIISDQGIPRRARVINLAEVIGRCNAFFVTHVVVLQSKERLDPIIIGDFGGGSGMGMRDKKRNDIYLNFSALLPQLLRQPADTAICRLHVQADRPFRKREHVCFFDLYSSNFHHIFCSMASICKIYLKFNSATN